VIEENGYTGRQCTQCGLIFVSPRPSEAEMEAMYAEGDAYLSADFFVDNRESLAVRAHAKREVRRLRKYVGRGSLLELGPGRGTFLAAARDAGFDVYGVELNPRQARFVTDRLGIPCVTSLDDVAALGVQKFDVIYHCSVLSHFYDPIAEFQRFNALLNPGGHIVFETGNLGDVDHRAFRYVSAFQYPDHLFFFGVPSIDALLRQTGFRHLRTYRYSNLPEAIVSDQLRRLRAIAARRGSGRSDEAGPAPTHAPETGQDRTRRRVFHGPGMVARQALDLLYYGLQTTVGATGIGRRSLQTLVVVANKPA
jgi:SAM-dependent methyltransferase